MPRLAQIPRNQPSAAPVPVITGNVDPSTNNPVTPGPTAGDQSQSQSQSQHQQTQQGQSQQPDANDSIGTGTGVAAVPDSPRTFAARQRELARDLIIKEQQIEYLITRLPGIDSSEAEQETRIKELEKELRGVEGEREHKAKELRTLVNRLEDVMGAVRGGVLARRRD
jgi:mediator of RNA polymerase II transcription subunit 21